MVQLNLNITYVGGHTRTCIHFTQVKVNNVDRNFFVACRFVMCTLGVKSHDTCEMVFLVLCT